MSNPSEPIPLTLRLRRRLLDVVDDALVDLLALRQRVVRDIGASKRAYGLAPRDDARERAVLERARGRAQRRGLAAQHGERLLRTAVDCAVELQRQPDLDQGGAGSGAAIVRLPDAGDQAMRLLRLLPPPERLAVPLRAVPYAWHARLLEAAVNHVLAAPQRAGKLAFMRGRRLAIEVTDLDLRWVLEGDDTRLHACAPGAEAEAAVRGKAIEFMLLASRLEDPDTLFFQRRLAVIGDTELGLTARNLLDQLPWEGLPLALRILLNRSARFAVAARDAHRAGKAA